MTKFKAQNEHKYQSTKQDQTRSKVLLFEFEILNLFWILCFVIWI